MVMALMMVSLPAFVSCGKDDDDDNSTYTYSTSEQTTLVTGFALQADADVLANLDSVHFTVDYDNGLIYNADSLPVGTDVSSLKVTVDFLNSVKLAQFIITGATRQADTTINYSSSMSQRLDFTGKTILRVTSFDETREKDYEVRVLVHKVNPDSLIWPMSWRQEMPGYRVNLVGHKAVSQGNMYRIMTYNGSQSVLWTATDPSQSTWNRQNLSLPFIPQISSLSSTDGALFILDADGVLYTSVDGMEWTSCGVIWHSILGSYDNRILGVVKGEDGYYHDEYPHTDGFEITKVENGFPVEHASNMVETSNTWTASQQSFIVGGIDSEGNLLNNVWGYDGSSWGKINNTHGTALPALADATLFPYYTYRTLKGVRRYGRQLTWYIMGGRLANGKLNGEIYLSSTQGVTWTQNADAIAQPSHMAKFYGAQAFVQDETISRSGANYVPLRTQTLVDSWECPYIYLFGGYNEQDVLLPYVWRGVYVRMTNYPLY